MNTNEHEKEKTVFTDDELLNIFTKNGTLKYVSIRNINKIKVQNPDAYKALVNRFDDSDSFKETIHRLKFGLYDKPCCPICGKKIANSELDEMYASVGFGAISSGKIVARMLEEYKKDHQTENLDEKLSKKYIIILSRK